MEPQKRPPKAYEGKAAASFAQNDDAGVQYYSVGPQFPSKQLSGSGQQVPALLGHNPEDCLEVNDKQFPGGKRLVPLLNPTVGQSRLLQRRISEGSIVSDAETRSPRSPDAEDYLKSPKSVGSGMGPLGESQSFFTDPGSTNHPGREYLQ